MTGNTKLSQLYAKDLARSFALPPGRSRGKQAAFAPMRTALSLVDEVGFELHDPSIFIRLLYQLSYSYFPNDVRGQAFRALLDTKCATPSCPSPNRGYQTIIPDGVPSLLARVRRALATGDQLFRRYGRTNAPPLQLSPLDL